MNLGQGQEPDETRQDQSMTDAAVALWQMPSTAFTGWWNLMIAPWLPGLPQRPHSDAHGQLVVPDPLENAGEHALFA